MKETIEALNKAQVTENVQNNHFANLYLFQISRMAGSHREAPVLREAPQAFKDVVYPPTEAHTTGMLEVLGIHCTALTALNCTKLICT